MATKVRVSKKGKLYSRDWLRGLYMAIAAPVMYFIIDWLSKDKEPFNWRTFATVALTAAVPYLLKNYVLEPAKVITTTDTNTKAVNAAERVKDVV